MDPYLESPTQWSDFHHRFVDDLADAINGALPGNYLARIDERLMLVTPMEDPPDRSNFRPDVTVVRSSRGGAGTGAAVLEPVTLENLDVIDPHTESYIKIVRLPDQELVTVIELLSPTNKYGEGRGDYVRKRRELLRQPVRQYWKLINYQEAPPAASFQADDTDWVAARSREGAR
jgi:hypothetical protein